MDFNSYIPLALRTAKPLPTAFDDFEHACLGLSTESGESNTPVKRVAIYLKDWDDLIKDSDKTLRQNALEELGDTLWYVPLALKALGFSTLPEVEQAGIEDLVAKTPTIKKCGLAVAGLSGVVCIQSVFGTWPSEMGPNDNDREMLGRTLSMLVHTIDRAAEMLGSSGDVIRFQNIEKLRERFPDAYSDAAAEARADKQGADATVS